ncbi:MAG TPA: prenyltransferase [Thermoplasmata archaeon]|nr:prenyltransferase [Thermoplasmata archaeon]
MKALAWVRASQAILFETSIVPALLGTAAAVSAGAVFRPEYLILILVSLVGIQAGANLFKGYYEGLDRSVAPSSPGAWFAFDSGAAIGLAREPKAVLHAGRACFAVGVAAGLGLVAITANLLLLAFGLAGAVLAWSYSSPPLRLSYRGIGEISTFLAFGPIMTVGATVAFGGAGAESSVFASLILGFLAAAISFARYFPNRDEDVAKGKRTPVTLLGVRRAILVFLGLLLAPYLVGSGWLARGDSILWMLSLAVFVALIARSLSRTRGRSPRYRTAIALTIVAHLVVGLALIADLAFRL